MVLNQVNDDIEMSLTSSKSEDSSSVVIEGVHLKLSLDNESLNKKKVSIGGSVNSSVLIFRNVGLRENSHLLLCAFNGTCLHKKGNDFIISSVVERCCTPSVTAVHVSSTFNKILYGIFVPAMNSKM